ncbi:MAG: GNAT family N-acetyltransferase, partial [Romboutsia sp.]
MNIRYAKEKEIENIKDMWSYCFNDGPAFMEYYFQNKYDNENTVVVADK